jgi:hypothetical protein
MKSVQRGDFGNAPILFFKMMDGTETGLGTG